eukprot:1019673-Prymnesium_polylepis.1
MGRGQASVALGHNARVRAPWLAVRLARAPHPNPGDAARDRSGHERDLALGALEVDDAVIPDQVEDLRNRVGALSTGASSRGLSATLSARDAVCPPSDSPHLVDDLAHDRQ